MYILTCFWAQGGGAGSFVGLQALTTRLLISAGPTGVRHRWIGECKGPMGLRHAL
jgi:hypothetical protein